MARNERQPFRDLSTSQAHVNPQSAVHKRISALKSTNASCERQVRGSKVVLARSPMQGKTPVDVKRASKKTAALCLSGSIPFPQSALKVHSDLDVNAGNDGKAKSEKDDTHVNPESAVHKRISALKSTNASCERQVRGSKVVLARSPMQGKTPVDVKRASKKTAALCLSGSIPFPQSALKVHSDLDVNAGSDSASHPAVSEQQHSAESTSDTFNTAIDPQPAARTTPLVLPFAPPPLAPRLVPLAPPLSIPPFEQAEAQARLGDTDASALHSAARFALFGAAASTQAAAKENACGNVVRPPPAPAPSQQELEAAAEAQRAARAAKKEEARRKREEALARRAEQGRLRAEEEARQLQERNDMVLDAVQGVDEDVTLEGLGPLRAVAWEMAGAVHALAVLQRMKVVAAVDPEEVEAALGAGGGVVEAWCEGVRQDLHWQLLQAARGGKGVGRKGGSALWRQVLREWAREELGDASPFTQRHHGAQDEDEAGATRKVKFSAEEEDDDEEEEEEEELDYDDLPVPARLSLLHDLVAAALGASISKDTSPADLRPASLGADSHGRGYWLVGGGGGQVAWLLREGPAATQSKTRDSLMSGGRTPPRSEEARPAAALDGEASLSPLSLNDTASGRSSSGSVEASPCGQSSAQQDGGGGSAAVEKEEEEEEDGPERGEAGENFHHHQAWTAAMSRASAPPRAPSEQVQLLATNSQRLALVTKALFSSAAPRDQDLAAAIAPLVRQARAVQQQRRVYGTRAATRPLRA